MWASSKESFSLFYANNIRRVKWSIKGKFVDSERVEQNIDGRSESAKIMRS
jgi:hypothetical protein